MGGLRAWKEFNALSDSLSATRVESPSSRVQRFNAALHENSHSLYSHARMHENSLARSLRGLHDARFVLNSHNSVGDWAVRGRGVCVPGETMALSTSTRLGVGRPAVEKLASPQQAPRSLHGEIWASLDDCMSRRGQAFCVPGCALVVACPSCPDNSLESPGPGRIIRNMLGWTLEEKTFGSGVRLFRGALQG